MSSPEAASADSNHTHVEEPCAKQDNDDLVADSPENMSEESAAHEVEDAEEESDDDDEEESEDESEEEEDEEPALKYERIGGSVGDLLKKDSASALAISNRLMVRQ